MGGPLLVMKHSMPYLIDNRVKFGVVMFANSESNLLSSFVKVEMALR